jgi:hypothetical protein
MTVLNIVNAQEMTRVVIELETCIAYTLEQGLLTFLPSHLPRECTQCSHLPSFPKLISQPVKTTI